MAWRQAREVTGKQGARVTIERGIEAVGADEFDALVIPGGYSPDKIRTSPGMVALTRDMHQALKPVAAICHAGWMLAEADIIRGKTVTSYHSIKTDLRNAGADWVDQELVEAVSDAGGIIITSRHPGDLPAFCDALLRQPAQLAATLRRTLLSFRSTLICTHWTNVVGA